ncbi:hypothetical protein [Rhodococcus sp. SGAir0479]|uniref:hypothetical protein n=1 Tax=Rhodococcus sp. SGAir0479 TaxID=2567884 RepID=UPI0010CD29B2|nr:hypothetical protein [Rhodococcus sp. SGAir0479]QCQ92542.1 hypothetical protein E7742_15825 [Rhodococcus sp. SGAir0479]
MKLRRIAATSVLVTAALGVGTGTSYAAPAPAPNPIGYQAHVEDRSVVTLLDAGGFHLTSDGRFVEITDDAGTVLQTLPLTYRLGDREFSIAPLVDGRKLTLTPEIAPARAVAADVAEPIDPANLAALGENLKVFEKLSEGVSEAVTTGSLVGTLVGAVVGCAIGGTPLALTGVAIPQAVLLCLGGAAAAAPVGGMIGTIVAGVPVLAYNGWQVYQTLNAAPPAAG